MDDEEFYRWYGPWASLSPPEVAALMDGISVPWWIFGGWSIEAFTGRPREHEDVDVGFFRSDLPAVLAHLLPRVCVWSNHGGTLRPLRTPEELLDGCEQLWVRRDGASPWLADLGLTPHDGTTWISKRDERIRLPFEQATFVAADGIRYLRPAVSLHMKARLQRDKDEADLAATLPLLEPADIAWLRETIALVQPDHSWLSVLDQHRALSRRPGVGDRVRTPRRDEQP